MDLLEYNRYNRTGWTRRGNVYPSLLGGSYSHSASLQRRFDLDRFNQFSKTGTTVDQFSSIPAIKVAAYQNAKRVAQRQQVYMGYDFTPIAEATTGLIKNIGDSISKGSLNINKDGINYSAVPTIPTSTVPATVTLTEEKESVGMQIAKFAPLLIPVVAIIAIKKLK